MRVVVTRPEHSGERTARRLAEMGHEAVLLPLSKPVRHAGAARASPIEHSGRYCRHQCRSDSHVGCIGPVSPSLISAARFSQSAKQPPRRPGKPWFHQCFRIRGQRHRAGGTDFPRHGPISLKPRLLYLAGSPRAARFRGKIDGTEYPIPDGRMLPDAGYRHPTTRPFAGSFSMLAPMPYCSIRIRRRYDSSACPSCSNIRVPSPGHDSSASAKRLPRPSRPRLHSHVDIADMPDEDSLLALLAAE